MALRLAFLRALPALEDCARLEAFLSYRLAPVLGGIKPAEILSLCRSEGVLFSAWHFCGEELLEAWGLKALCLREGPHGSCIVVYNGGTLAENLAIPPAKEFLDSLGYPTAHSVEDMWTELGRRFKEACPHELGLFLGIPWGDVRGFIEQKGKNYLFAGYWKVYEQPARAKASFKAYDHLKDAAIRRWLGNG
jgi:hypothetical protein